MDIKTFDRVEKKYFITSKQKRDILTILNHKMQKDEYFKSQVFNLYFDTDNFDLITKSIENPDFKEKLRARSYGGYDKVFLEIKTKLKQSGCRVGYKRRFLITHQDYKEFATGKKTAAELASRSLETKSDLQIAREVDYIVNYFNLKPQILVYYARESYIGENNLRITFDEDLSYRDKDLTFVRKAHDKKYFKDEKNIIMEIKAHGVLPLWLAQLLSKEKVYPTHFSKIAGVYKLIRKEKQNV